MKNLLNNSSEQIIADIACRKSLLFFWLPTYFLISNKRVSIHSRNAILGILPLGTSGEDLTYRSISSVKTSTKLHIFRFLIGAWLTFWGALSTLPVGFSAFSSNVGIVMFLLLVFGVLLLLHSYTATLKISNSSGGTTKVEVPYIEGRKLKKVAKHINSQLINY
ncbi:hypothetical protein [Priestia endophytica]|uniref:Uncharacterized protein n=1 Tax=Priestia endophytica DSM 13796 TaxID=1121089 RepID=A0A1I6C0P0_9BACI|nr:hypothetical protein [Priestia endophytica]KYG33413.1 hypothetical protein AZF06_21450 [Priestia endophytica]SFQ86753.1 hypothetical protein SAMN02745910_04714 [Priestia endophytica DSM 13796]